MHTVEDHDDYFVQKRNATNKFRLSYLQKVTVAFHMLCNGVAADITYKYVCIGESTTIKRMRRHVIAVVDIFEAGYLRSPNENNITRLLVIVEERGFLSMLGFIGCLYWKWKNCPTAWHGMYSGHVRVPTIILEVVASKDPWIWYAFFFVYLDRTMISTFCNSLNYLQSYMKVKHLKLIFQSIDMIIK
jgi:hypothetical protein